MKCNSGAIYGLHGVHSVGATTLIIFYKTGLILNVLRHRCTCQKCCLSTNTLFRQTGLLVIQMVINVPKIMLLLHYNRRSLNKVGTTSCVLNAIFFPQTSFS